MSITIKDIAKATGFSMVTISRALFPGSNRAKVNKGDNIVMIGFGGGLSWAAVLYEWI